jgi:hypothetical protein
MIAWNNAVIINTAAGYRDFLTLYPDSDLTATARKLEDRLRNRPSFATAVAAGGSPGGTPGSSQPINAALGPTCPCSTPLPVPLNKVELPPRKNADPDRPKRAGPKPRRGRAGDDDVAVYRGPPPPDYYEPAYGPPVGAGIYGGGFRGGFRGRGLGWRRGY